MKILDGGLGTELVRQGFVAENDPMFGGSLLHSNPDGIRQVHLSFLEAGANVITTASYQASLEGFKSELNLDTTAALQLMASSVKLAREACDDFMTKNKVAADCSETITDIMVAGSVGPRGAALHDGSEYHGRYVDGMTIEDLKDWHRPRLQCLVDAGADLVAIETQPAEKEARALVELLKEFPSTKAWLSFSCKDSLHTCHGELFSSAVASCLSVDSAGQLLAVGVNCTHPSQVTSLLSSAATARGSRPFVVYPNSGEVWTENKSWSGGESCPSLLTYVDDWVNTGVTWLGGCCRVYPQDIATIKHRLVQLKLCVG